jgi:RsiW-degrading membrane proteinase PrsW (M82 family)
MSAATFGDLERRRTAIETSGWGARFHFVQPHNACFWVYLALVASGAWYVINAVASTGGAFNQAYATAVVTSGLFCAAFLAFLHHADRWERTPGSLALAAFVGGGLASTFAIAIIGNAALMSLYTKAFGQAWAVDWEAGLTAPFVEETAKGAMFVLLLGLAPVVIRTAADGLIVGAYVGLGFQIIEDVLYAQNSAFAAFGAHQADAVLSLFVLRAITGIPSHALYTALFGAGVIYALGTTAQPRRLGRGILLMLSAIVIHGVWDSASAIGGPVWVILVLLAVTVGSIVMLLIAIRWAGRRERQYMHDIMAPEVASGTITDAELVALTGHRDDTRSAIRARTTGVSRRREKHVLQAAHDLAADLAEGAGEDTPDVLHARAEIARLRADPATRQP